MDSQTAVARRAAPRRPAPAMAHKQDEIGQPLLFFDERCSVCRRFVAFAVHADRTGRLRLAPLTGALAEALRRANPRFLVRETAVWLPVHGGPVGYSDAILGVLDYLGGGWRLLAAGGRLVPRPLRDRLYRWFAEHRQYVAWLGLPELEAATRRRVLDVPPAESRDVAIH